MVIKVAGDNHVISRRGLKAKEVGEYVSLASGGKIQVPEADREWPTPGHNL